MSDNQGQYQAELYWAEMEAARNKTTDAYFSARPQLMRTIEQEKLFQAGFERAFRICWDERQPLTVKSGHST